MNEYPAMRFMLQQSRWLPGVASAIVVIGGAYIVARTGDPVWLVAAIIVGAALFLIVKSYVELLKLIADMLLPR
jgi:hypothetical protein